MKSRAMPPTAPVPPFDPLSPEVLADPYPAYARLRMSDPVHWGIPHTRAGAWYVFRHADIASLLRDPRLSRRRPATGRGVPSGRPISEPYRGFLRMMAQQVGFQNTVGHARLRAVMGPLLSPRAVAGVVPRVEWVARKLLQDIEDQHSMDVLNEYALPLVLRVLAELQGVPESSFEELRAWIGVISSVSSSSPKEELLRANRAVAEYGQLVEGLAGEAGGSPQGTVLAGMLAARELGQVSQTEFVANLLALLDAGTQTTADFITNSVLVLLSHQDQLKLLREDPQLLGYAVQELLRFESPVQIVGRWATESFVFQGKGIERGQVVYLVLGSANRDPSWVSDPDRLDLKRKLDRTAAFGGGTHYCLGAPLARLIGGKALEILLQWKGSLSLQTSRLIWRPAFGFRGLTELRVSW
ncbi:cytochrome P450 [Meiothermus sp. PNK-Is4]|nr:cytochrome P450 [Meiothermus sp. PNK-Is4]